MAPGQCHKTEAMPEVGQSREPGARSKEQKPQLVRVKLKNVYSWKDWPLELATIPLELPITVVQRTDVARLEPARDAMEVEGMVARAPGHGALLVRVGSGIRLALDAQIHDRVAADGAVVDVNVPRPHGHRIPALDLEAQAAPLAVPAGRGQVIGIWLGSSSSHLGLGLVSGLVGLCVNVDLGLANRLWCHGLGLDQWPTTASTLVSLGQILGIVVGHVELGMAGGLVGAFHICALRLGSKFMVDDFFRGKTA